MKTNIILVGVGGQGVISIAAVIGLAARNNNLYIKQTEVHGMSQRGGVVQSHLRLSTKPIYSDLIPTGQADIILSLEPMEVLRYLPYLSKGGYVITNIIPVNNIPDYPDITEIMKIINSLDNKIAFDADSIAKDCGSSKFSNMVMLGAASSFIAIPFASLEQGVSQLFAKNEAVVNMNLKALQVGREFKKNLI